MKLFSILILIVVISCGKKESKSNECILEPMETLDGRETALVIGDSISIGYTPTLKTEFPQYQVIHNDCNGRHSRHGSENVERWSSHSPQWKFCTINHGVWDIIPYMGISIDEYKTNLTHEISVLSNVCESVIYVNATRIPVNYNPVMGAQGAIELRNTAAETLMGQLNIPVCDLYSVSNTITHLHDNAVEQNDVHFIPQGSEILGQALAQCIRNNI